MNTALNESIKARCTQIKMSQEYAADQLGTNRQAVAKWETGTSEPIPKNLSKLASLFETSISELVDPQAHAEEQETQEQKLSTKQRNAKMLFGRWGTTTLMNTDWDGYSSGLHGIDFPYYWLVILAVGLVLLSIISKDMGKEHRPKALQIIFGLPMIFSVFFLSRIIPSERVGVTHLLANVITTICAILLSLKYWWYTWRVK